MAENLSMNNGVSPLPRRGLGRDFTFPRQAISPSLEFVSSLSFANKFFSLPRRDRHIAFTIAEVLITLGIIGVVAAMTLPTLIQKQNEKATVTALKKFYTNLEQALRLEQNENPDNYSGENLIKHFKIIKLCNKGDTSCAKQTYKFANNTIATGFGINDKYIQTNNYAQLADGAIVRFGGERTDCSIVAGTSTNLQNVCGEFSVDINGDKGPNILGRDVFYFKITKFGVVPSGTEEDNKTKFTKQCKDFFNQQGYGCAAWVIYNENIDYLHCNDLDWNTKTKCK